MSTSAAPATLDAPAAPHRLSDEQMRRFIVDGYVVLHPPQPEGFHAEVFSKIATVMESGANPFNNILPAVPELAAVFEHPQVVGALASILGEGYYLHLHRHCHERPPGTAAQSLHQDSLINSRFAVDGTRRHHHTRWAMAFYYPQDTSVDMGPTGIVPGSQYLNEAPAAEAEIALDGPAGTVVIVHYDIWHRAQANTTVDRERYMVKFLFTRLEDPVMPSWDHQDPASDGSSLEVMSASGGAGRPALPRVWEHMWRWHLGTGNGAGAVSGSGGVRAAGNATAADARELAARLADADEQRALDASYQLGSSGQAGIGALAAALADADERRHRNAAYGFAPAGSDAAPVLGGLLQHDDAAVRARAADTLGDLGPAALAAASQLAACCTDADDTVRAHAVDALGTICAGGGTSGSNSTNGSNGKVAGSRDANANANGAIASGPAALATALGDDCEVVRRNAALSLARLGAAGGREPAVTAQLAAALHDESHYVRGYAVLALGRLATAGARAALMQYLEAARWDPSQRPR